MAKEPVPQMRPPRRMVEVEVDMLTGCHLYPEGTNRKYAEDGSPAVNLDELCRATGYSEESASWVRAIRATAAYQNEVRLELTRRKLEIADTAIAQLSPIGRIATRLVNELEVRLEASPHTFTNQELLTMIPKWLTLALKFRAIDPEDEDGEGRKKAYKRTQKAKQEDRRVTELIEGAAEEDTSGTDDYPS